MQNRKLWTLSMFIIFTTKFVMPDDMNRNTRGTEYVIGFMDNHEDYKNIQLFLVNSPENEAAANVTVSSPHGSFSSVFSVDVFSSVSLPSTIQHIGNDLSKKGIRITSSHPISVYGTNGRYRSIDTYLAFPSSLLGKEYIVITYYVNALHRHGGSQFLIIGVEDGTSVQVTVTNFVRYEGIGYGGGSKISLSLNALDSVQFQSSYDLTGSRIVSSKIVSVFSGNKCDNIPRNIKLCDHMVSQVPPLNLWGDTYITTPLATRTAGDVFRVLASENNSSVTISGLSSPVVLDSSQFYEIDIPSTESWLISADKPILVAQFCKSYYADAVIADPFMAILPSLDNFITGTYALVTFDILRTSDEKHYINIVVDCLAKSGFSSSPPVNVVWLNVEQKGFCIGTAELSAGVYYFTQSEEVGYQVLVYALGRSSYGYPLALQFGETGQGDATTPVIRAKEEPTTTKTETMVAKTRVIFSWTEATNFINTVEPKIEETGLQVWIIIVAVISPIIFVVTGVSLFFIIYHIVSRKKKNCNQYKYYKNPDDPSLEIITT